MSTRLPKSSCDYRWSLPQRGVYYCRHPQMHTEHQLVHAGICDGCPLAGKVSISPRPQPKLYPTWYQRLFNFMRAAWKHLQGRQQQATPQEQIRRRTICMACGYFDPQKQTCAHLGCGCHMKAKWSWASSHCPLNPPKW